jgi:lipoyl(octanoyl) transferase
LWLGDDKLAACGIHIRRGVAIHGFALDVATPPEAWRAIVPCGLSGARVVSIERASGSPAPSIEAVARRAAPAVCRALGYRPSETRASIRS